MKIMVFTLTFLLGALTCEAKDGADAADLAFGYANAFQCMNKSTVSVTYSNSGQSEVIKDVKEIKSFGGVLLIKIYNGDQQILDAARVVKISSN